jgi:tyrosyl-tRNA synthetase
VLVITYKFYQFWLNTDDETAEDLIKIYTLLPKSEVEAIIADHRANPGARSLQKILAREVTELIHGVDRRESVERVTKVLFGGENFDSLNGGDIEQLSAEIPTVVGGKRVSELLVDADMTTSLGEARRLIIGGAVSVNGEKIAEDISIERQCLLKKGKNSFALVTN